MPALRRAAAPAELLNDQAARSTAARVLLLGVTYKPDIADQRESPAVDAGRAAAVDLGAVLEYHDPYVADSAVRRRHPASTTSSTVAAEADVTILLQHHLGVRRRRDRGRATALLDTRGVATDSGTTRL